MTRCKLTTLYEWTLLRARLVVVTAPWKVRDAEVTMTDSGKFNTVAPSTSFEEGATERWTVLGALNWTMVANERSTSGSTTGTTHVSRVRIRIQPSKGE